MRRPDFIIIGAMKAGTTTLWEYLRRHPEIFMCYPKEPQFFSREHIFQRGVEWYEDLFAEATGTQVCGEASTCYSRAPHFSPVAKRIFDHCPDVKLIYILRNPVERAYSHYAHLMRERFVRKKGPITGFAEALAESPEIVDASRYAYQIEQYRQYFSEEQILILDFEDLRTDPALTLRRVQQFLGVAHCNTTDENLHANERGSGIAQIGWRKTVRRIRRTPLLDSVFDCLPSVIRQRIGRMIRAEAIATRVMRHRERAFKRQLPPFDETTRALLQQALEEDEAQLRRLLNWAPGSDHRAELHSAGQNA